MRFVPQNKRQNLTRYFLLIALYRAMYELQEMRVFYWRQK